MFSAKVFGAFYCGAIGLKEGLILMRARACVPWNRERIISKLRKLLLRASLPWFNWIFRLGAVCNAKLRSIFDQISERAEVGGAAN
jgi:hypothetical protein